jgi:hypothetical protein
LCARSSSSSSTPSSSSSIALAVVVRSPSDALARDPSSDAKTRARASKTPRSLFARVVVNIEAPLVRV